MQKNYLSLFNDVHERYFHGGKHDALLAWHGLAWHGKHGDRYWVASSKGELLLAFVDMFCDLVSYFGRNNYELLPPEDLVPPSMKVEDLPTNAPEAVRAALKKEWKNFENGQKEHAFAQAEHDRLKPIIDAFDANRAVTDEQLAAIWYTLHSRDDREYEGYDIEVLNRPDKSTLKMWKQKVG